MEQEKDNIPNHKPEIKVAFGSTHPDARTIPRKTNDNNGKQGNQNSEEEYIFQQQQNMVEKYVKETNQKNKNLNFLFENQRDKLWDKPYYQDGDPTLYTEEMIEIRNKLKDDKDVKQMINKFMTLYKFDNDGRLSKDGYIQVQKQISIVLRPELEEKENEEELNMLIDADWEHDSQNNDKMTRQQLYDSIYELLDIWCPTVEKMDYLEILETLAEKCGKPDLFSNNQK